LPESCRGDNQRALASDSRLVAPSSGRSEPQEKLATSSGISTTVTGTPRDAKG